MDDQKRLEECIQYFKQRKIYDKLFSKAADKYRSLGHFGGSVQLAGLSTEDYRHLGGFFQKDYEGQKTVTISAAAMEKALEASRFAGLRWEDILESYFGQELVGRKEQRQQENAEREGFFARIMETDPKNPGSLWLSQVLQDKGEGYLLLMKHYREQPEKLKSNLLLLLQAIPKLPVLAAAEGKVSHELLAVFAAAATGDPHFFDAGTLGEQLLLSFLTSRFWDSLSFFPESAPAMDFILMNTMLSRFPQETDYKAGQSVPCGKEKHVARQYRAEEKAGIFYRAGLLKDDLSNHALVYGICGRGKDGMPHKGILGYLEQREPLHLTLMTLGRLAQVRPQKGKRVYIVENPAVFAVLAGAWPEAAILCGNGQIRLAMLVLLDLFERDIEFWYAGDYDPEGLLIAQKLRERYGERLHFWKYSREYYEKYRSDVEINGRSLKKLDRIYQEELQEIRQALELQKKAAYQETMMAEYLADGQETVPNSAQIDKDDRISRQQQNEFLLPGQQKP